MIVSNARLMSIINICKFKTIFSNFSMVDCTCSSSMNSMQAGCIHWIYVLWCGIYYNWQIIPDAFVCPQGQRTYTQHPNKKTNCIPSEHGFAMKCLRHNRLLTDNNIPDIGKVKTNLQHIV